MEVQQASRKSIFSAVLYFGMSICRDFSPYNFCKIELVKKKESPN